MSSDKVVCPYNPVHVIERSKIVTHMSRCSRSFTGKSNDLIHCPFDNAHVIPQQQLEEHVRNCSAFTLALPLHQSVQLDNAVTGNLRLPANPPELSQLATGEWDRQPVAQHSAPGTAATSVAASIARGRGVASCLGDGSRQRMQMPGRRALNPGDTTANGYVVKDIQYPQGFTPRGAHQLRGSV